MEQVVLPNIRKIFIPDPGYDIYDCDLSGADAQVVAWEAGDEDLKQAFREGLDVHVKNATDMWGDAFTSLPGDKHGGPYKKKRQSCKHAVHATNYAANPKAVAGHPSINWPIAEATNFQKRWFTLHPKIGPVSRPGSWHHRIQSDLDRNKTVRNMFGYRRVFFDRPDAVFPEALAWVPQSTIALVSFYGALQLEASPAFRLPRFATASDDEIYQLRRKHIRFSYVEMLLQNHDSIVFQLPTRFRDKVGDIRRGLSITIPYSDPLTIPWGISRSDVSWGDCVDVKEAA